MAALSLSRGTVWASEWPSVITVILALLPLWLVLSSDCVSCPLITSYPLILPFALILSHGIEPSYPNPASILRVKPRSVRDAGVLRRPCRWKGMG